MKIQQSERAYQPITVTFENKKEAETFWGLIDKLDRNHRNSKRDVNLSKEEYGLIISLSDAWTNRNILL